MYDLWAVYEHSAAQESQLTAERAGREVRDTNERMRKEVARLESKLDGLALTCQALWEVIRDQTHLSDEDVLERMRLIDERDGRRDGRMSGRPVECGECARPGHTRQRVCMYCGADLGSRHIFNQT